MPCRINVFSGRKRERSPRENPLKGDCGFLRGDLSRFRPCLSYLCLAGRKVATRKHAKWWFWRAFAPPGKDTTNRRRKGDAWKVSYFCVAGRKVAMRKHENDTIWRVFAWRLFAFSPRKHDNTTWHKSATIATTTKWNLKAVTTVYFFAYENSTAATYTRHPEPVIRWDPFQGSSI